ncbi:phage/plasmid primase, P4 family [Niallia sp. JL1B1071]|uniref:phage/plasmid primase, P4 family n=1 Tax=Niallia tiangongensis TaxID=3237105 RepID=UPI0037DD0E37
MLKEEKILNYDLPQELREARIFVCTKTEQIGKEEVTTSWDPTTDEQVDASNPSYLMTLEDALELKENAPKYANAGIGLVLRRENPYISIEILDAKNSNGELSEVARETTDMLTGSFYGEFVGSSLKMIVKGFSIGNHQFKNIKVNYFDSDHLVPLKGSVFRKPKSPWSQSEGLEKIKEYHFKKNCQVDENSKTLPEHYIKTNSGLKLLPNVLVSTLLRQKEWLICNSMVYARDKSKGIFQKVGIDEVELEILDYMSPKYLTNKDIEDTKKLLLKRIPKDNELTDSIRMKEKVNFKNGVYDIESSTFGSYEQSYKTAFQLNVGYQMDAQCPRFEEYIAASLTKEDADTVQEMIGYLLTTEMKAQKAFIMYGPGNTGKSTLIEIIEGIIGRDYVSNVPFQELGAKYRTVKLFGKLLNSYADLPQGTIKDTSVFKALVSGDSMHADDKYEKGFDFNNTARLLFAANKLPSNYVDQTSGFYRRLTLIPFQNVVSNENIDRNLKEEMFKEREGIVQWALIGLKRLISNNYQFTESDGSKNLMKEYKKGNNSVLWFCDEFCLLNLAAKVSGKRLYDEYKKECLDAKVSAVPQREFYSQVECLFANEGVAKRQGSQTRAVEFVSIKLR